MADRPTRGTDTAAWAVYRLWVRAGCPEQPFTVKGPEVDYLRSLVGQHLFTGWSRGYEDTTGVFVDGSTEELYRFKFAWHGRQWVELEVTVKGTVAAEDAAYHARIAAADRENREMQERGEYWF